MPGTLSPEPAPQPRVQQGPSQHGKLSLQPRRLLLAKGVEDRSPGLGNVWVREVKPQGSESRREMARLGSPMGCLPLPFSFTKHPGSSNQPHRRTGTRGMWSGARSGQNLLRHRFYRFYRHSSAQCPCPLGLAWPVVATEESAKLPVANNISHVPPKYLNPNSFLNYLLCI